MCAKLRLVSFVLGLLCLHFDFKRTKLALAFQSLLSKLAFVLNGVLLVLFNEDHVWLLLFDLVLCMLLLQFQPSFLDHSIYVSLGFLYLLLFGLDFIVHRKILGLLYCVSSTFDNIPSHLLLKGTLLVSLELELIEALERLLDFFVFHVHLALEV